MKVWGRPSTEEATPQEQGEGPALRPLKPTPLHPSNQHLPFGPNSFTGPQGVGGSHALQSMDRVLPEAMWTALPGIRPSALAAGSGRPSSEGQGPQALARGQSPQLYGSL